MKKGLRILICCKNCVKIRTVIPSIFKRQKNIFCNAECAKEWKSKPENNYQYNKVTVDCSNPNCEKQVIRKKSQIDKYKTNFCDRKCFAEYKSLNQVKEKHHNWKGRFKVKCAWCNTEKEVQYHLKDRPKHFCPGKKGRECQDKWRSKYQSGENASNWQGGIDDHGYGQEFNKPFKRKIRKRDNRKCCFCNRTHKKLNVHHVDYDKENNNKNNLITLCPKCHGKTNHNRKGWTKFILEHYKNELNNFTPN